MLLYIFASSLKCYAISGTNTVPGFDVESMLNDMQTSSNKLYFIKYDKNVDELLDGRGESLEKD